MLNFNFKKQPNGYDRNQVNKYIRLLMKAYQKIHIEYLTVADNNKALAGIIGREIERQEFLHNAKIPERIS